MAVVSGMKYDWMVELLPLLNTLLLLWREVMPRKRATHPPDHLSPDEIPAWFAEFSDVQDSEEGVLTWLRDYDPESLRHLLVSVLDGGGALFVSLTRDKGALGLTIMFGDTKKRIYVVTSAELDIMVQRMS